MTWVRLDDGMPEHEKVAGLTDRAFRAHIEAICYSARNLTDGRLVRAIVRKNGWERDTASLVAAGVWEAADDGWLIHDYLEYNPLRAEVERERESRRTGGRVRASQAARAGGRFTSAAPAPDQQPAGDVLAALHQPRPDPDPDPDPDLPDPTDQVTHTTRAKKSRATVVDEGFIAEMVARHSTIPADRVREEIADALGHTAAGKRTDLRAYVRVWLARTSWSAPPSRNGRQPATYASAHGQERGSDVWDGIVHRE